MKEHILKVAHQRVKFKVACLVRQSLSGQAPLYLADDCRLVSDSTRRSLRSADVSTCVLQLFDALHQLSGSHYRKLFSVVTLLHSALSAVS